MSDIEIKIANNSYSHQWNDFLNSFPRCDNHAYLWEWREIIEKSFAHKPYYIVALENNNIVGVLPLFHVKSLIFGNSLISIPYTNAGGALANSQEIINKLINFTKDLGEKLSVSYLELRFREKLDTTYLPYLTEQIEKVTMILPFQSTTDETFNSFSTKLRSQIRRPEKAEVQVKTYAQTNLKQGINLFYKVFSKHMRDLGTPTYPQKFITSICEQFNTQATIFIAFLEAKPIAAGLTISRAEYSEILLASSLKEYNNISPNMLMYWHAMQHASQKQQAKFFDFGRTSKDSGTYKFKKQWGSIEKQLYWYSYCYGKKEKPNTSASNSKFSLLQKCWKKLPLPLANLLGRIVTKWLP